MLYILGFKHIWLNGHMNFFPYIKKTLFFLSGTSFLFSCITLYANFNLNVEDYSNPVIPSPYINTLNIIIIKCAYWIYAQEGGGRPGGGLRIPPPHNILSSFKFVLRETCKIMKSVFLSFEKVVHQTLKYIQI